MQNLGDISLCFSTCRDATATRGEKSRHISQTDLSPEFGLKIKYDSRFQYMQRFTAFPAGDYILHSACNYIWMMSDRCTTHYCTIRTHTFVQSVQCTCAWIFSFLSFRKYIPGSLSSTLGIEERILN